MAAGVDISAANLNPVAMEPGKPAEIPNEEKKDSDFIKIEGDQLDFRRHKEAFEREFIVKALTMFKGRINQTALHANIPKKTLLRKIEKYGLNAKDYTAQ